VHVAADAATFGELLREYRLAAGMTQEALAERAQLSAHGIQKLERGLTHPYRDTVRRLEAALRLVPEEQARFQAAVHPLRRHGTPWPHEADSRAGERGHNLPLALTSLIGRERDVIEVRARLTTERLVTLTGVGGCGKTRLALEVARHVLAAYEHGVWLVELGPLADPTLVAHRVGVVLGVREKVEAPMISVLVGALALLC
jgi:transcriptional regulator with XRE-family HTH domain